MPLRIVKRSDSSCGTGRGGVDGRSPRTCSQETDESRGSAPEPPGGGQQLTIPKVRGSRSSRVLGSLDDVDESPVPLGRDPYLLRGRFELWLPCFAIIMLADFEWQTSLGSETGVS